MSNLILNDNVIGGSSNDSSDILYTPNDNRAETNVQAELDKINTQLNGCVRFPNYSQQETVTSGWVATYDCLLTYSIIGIANQVDTAVAIDGKGVARAATNTGSITVQNSICVKKGQRIELSGYSPSGTLIVYPLE